MCIIITDNNTWSFRGPLEFVIFIASVGAMPLGLRSHRLIQSPRFSPRLLLPGTVPLPLS